MALVQGEKLLLREVLNNLIDNATKYTHDHGQIEVTLEAHDDKAQLIVADNGIGLSPEICGAPIAGGGGFAGVGAAGGLEVHQDHTPPVGLAGVPGHHASSGAIRYSA